jgi:DNA-binding NtrC family response regulator
MLVDDNVNLVNTMARILRKKGYDVLVATDGHAAVELAKNSSTIDIVFLDIKMPGINGVETFKQMKSHLPNMKAVMMTAYAVDDLIQEALREGAQGILYKPVDFDEIVKLIKKLCAGQDDAHILIVDDDDIIRSTFTRILETRGYSVLSAASGEEAVRIVADSPLDLMFIDMKLPGMDGYDTYLAIKSLHPDASSIIMTGYSEEMADRIEQLMLHSAYSYLQKPVDMTQVFGLMDEILSTRRKVALKGGACE